MYLKVLSQYTCRIEILTVGAFKCVYVLLLTLNDVYVFSIGSEVFDMKTRFECYLLFC